MALKRVYFGLDLETLTQMREQTLKAIQRVKVGQSVGLPDMSLSLPSLNDLQIELAEINAAIEYAKGNYNPISISSNRLNTI